MCLLVNETTSRMLIPSPKASLPMKFSNLLTAHQKIDLLLLIVRDSISFKLDSSTKIKYRIIITYQIHSHCKNSRTNVLDRAHKSQKENGGHIPSREES